MLHTFRKYLSNRGSALFMVLSTMTALMISCMAMYFSVISSRSTQYAVFNQQQAYQSAASMSDAIIASMMDGTFKETASGKSFVSKLAALKNPGDKITTNANGFLAFAPTGSTGATNEEVDQLGAYMMEVTYLGEEVLADKTVIKAFDILITTSVNGNKEAFHTIFQMSTTVEESTAPPGSDSLFTSTGYIPNDVFLDGGVIVTDVFFDNEITYVGAYGGKQMHFDGNVYCGGSLYVDSYFTPISKRPTTLAVRGNYTNTFNQAINFCGDSGVERSTVMIGGDAHFENASGGVGFSNANVYINGDMYIKTSTTLSSTNNTYFVNGKIYVYDSPNYWLGFLKDIYVDENDVILDNPLADWAKRETKGPWSACKEAGYLTREEMISKLVECTESNVYYKWLPEKKGMAAAPKTIKLSTDSGNPIPTALLKYSAAEHGCILEDVVCTKGNTSFNDIALVIDTGDDPDNIYTIEVKANRDLDNDGKLESFSFYPRFTEDGADGKKKQESNTTQYMSILVMGRGSVVIHVPDGVSYQHVSNMKIMHYGWFVLGGGVEDHTYGSDIEKTIYKVKDTSYKYTDLIPFVHRTCNSASDGCTYTEKDSTDVCTACNEKKIKVVTCTVHGAVKKYCPKCEPNKAGPHSDLCENRVGIKEIDKYLTSHAADKTRLTYTDGKIAYPNTNIFLVSTDENADFRFSAYTPSSANFKGTVIDNSTLFGYIYAPYMTFKAGPQNSYGDVLRLFGGLTVSDYIIDDSMAIMACYPTKMPTELMNKESLATAMPSLASKKWKISLNGH